MSLLRSGRSASSFILSAMTIGIAIVLVLAVVSGIRSVKHAAPATIPGSEARPAASSASLAAVAVGGASYDLAYDPASDTIWMAIMGEAGPDQLVGVNATTEKLTRITLPDADYNGFTSRVQVGSGYIWVTQPYRIIRFDPGSGAVSSVDLALDVPGALPGSLDPSNPLPGTWVSSLATDGDIVLIARNNVPFLVMMDAGLHEVGTIAVPANYAGAQDMAVVEGETLWIVSGPTGDHQIGEFHINGNLVAEYAGGGTRLETTGGETVALGLAGGASVLASGGPVSLGTDLGRTDGSRLSTDGRGTVTIYDESTGAIYLVKAGKVVASISTPETSADVPKPLGGTARVRVRARITDVVMDMAGDTWYFDANAQTAVRITW